MPPRGPTKAPYVYVHESLIDFGMRHVTDAFLRSIAVDHRTMIPLNKLRPQFANTQEFQDFKSRYMIYIPDEHWEMAVNNNDRLRSYANRFMQNPFKRRPLKMKSYVRSRAGLARYRKNPASDDESLLSVDPTNDDCDDTNVNLPKSVCRGVRSVCRYYDDRKRYTNWERDDGSEHHLYAIDVDYDEQPKNNKNNNNNNNNNMSGDSDDEY